MPEASEYVLGTGDQERARLESQRGRLAGPAREFLDRIGVRRGWRVVDVGCGPGGVLDLLSERVGPDGEVVGLEREPLYVEQARAFVAERGLANVRIVAGDLRERPVAGGFDLVHERLVLINLPYPAQVIAAMRALARPGGVVAAQEFDWGSVSCEPPHPACERLTAAVRALAPSTDGWIGRRLYGLLRRAGLLDVDAAVVGPIAPSTARGAPTLGAAASLRDEFVARGIIPADEVDGVLAAALAHRRDPEAFHIGPFLVQAWGRTPA